MDLAAVILGMALVTHIPRVLPPAVMRSVRLPAWFTHWLQCIPFAALGALIFPGILKVNPEEPLVGLAGGLTAALLALLRAHILIIMVLAILTASLCSYWLV